ncbi:MAG: shikimate dehydrogenase [Verrucomicrobia bacterium]|nr:shikimate dehydrogenase [Verrucomicrobiota bacterium]
MGTLLFGVIPGPDVKAAEQLAMLARPYVDGIELRLDSFAHIDIAELQAFLRTCSHPVMFTVRRSDQGGEYKGTEQQRLDLLESLCPLGPAYLDLEYDVPLDFRKRLFETYPRILFLSSYHDFSGMPEDLTAVYDKVKTPYAHIFKLAVMAKTSNDSLKMLAFVESRSKSEKIIGICMGEEGKPSRILAPVVGNHLTYATIASTASTAPGQLTAKDLQDIYRFSKLDRQTSIFSLVGTPVDKSLGHLIHNAVFEQLSLNAVYIKTDVKKEDLTAFFELTRGLPFKGFSVTMPYKEDVMPLLAQSSIQAQVIGVCNTIQVKDRKMIGYNTDGIGALNALERREIVYGKHVVFIGAGGAARAMIFEAIQRGAYVSIINRTAEKATEIAKAFGGQGGGWELLPKVCAMGYDFIVNCIPESDLIEEKWILPEKIAMDIVYVPKNTPFLVKASRKKCRIVFGYEMFIGQALEQQRIWFPSGIDFDKAYQIIEEKVMSALA